MNMKLILAIMSNDDAPTASSALTKEGYSVTRLATTGGFLRAGNTTLLVGVEDEKVENTFIFFLQCLFLISVVKV